MARLEIMARISSSMSCFLPGSLGGLIGIGDVVSGGWDMNGILYPLAVTLCTQLSFVKACHCLVKFSRQAPTLVSWSESEAVVNVGVGGIAVLWASGAPLPSPIVGGFPPSPSGLAPSSASSPPSGWVGVCRVLTIRIRRLGLH